MRRWVSISAGLLFLASSAFARVAVTDKGHFIKIEDFTAGIQNLSYIRKDTVLSLHYFRNKIGVTLTISTTERVPTERSHKNRIYTYHISAWSETERLVEQILELLNQAKPLHH